MTTSHQKALETIGLIPESASIDAEMRAPTEKDVARVRAARHHSLQTLAVAQQPVLLIAYGPPGSGKSSCFGAFFDAASEHGFDRNSFFNLNVDDLVSELDERKLVLRKPDSYTQFRPAANALFQELLEASLRSKRHLLIEMTGSALDPAWLNAEIVNPARKNGYSIIVVYPLVPVDELVIRSEKRALSIGRSPPSSYIRQSAPSSARNLAHFMGVADYIFVFDNRSTQPCRFRILQCDKHKCTGSCEWTRLETCAMQCDGILGAIKQEFDVEIAAIPMLCGVKNGK